MRRSLRHGFWDSNTPPLGAGFFYSELFGYERDAFTGAQTARAGWFEQADRATIFLDDIGEMPLAMQTKLLRTLQEGTTLRLGGKREVKVTVRGLLPALMASRQSLLI